MGCASGGCSAGGCGFKGESSTSLGASGGCGSGGCANGNCGSDTWDGTYRDVVGVKVGYHARTFYCDSTGFHLMTGETCVVESDTGDAFATVGQATGPSRKFSGLKGMKKVLRRTRPEDEAVNERNTAARRESLGYCRDRVRELNLDMKLVNVDASFDERKLTLYFTAEERVDFRELVRDLAQRFRRRIEMRQIGARDEAKILGGYGICGRPLCCSTFLLEFAPISVKMAKRQGLSLNPSKISGLCGRLMCCLRYEDYDDGRAVVERKNGEGKADEAPPAPVQPQPPAAAQPAGLPGPTQSAAPPPPGGSEGGADPASSL